MPPRYIYKIAMPKYSKKQGGYNQFFDTPNIPTISVSYRSVKMINHNSEILILNNQQYQ